MQKIRDDLYCERINQSAHHGNQDSFFWVPPFVLRGSSLRSPTKTKQGDHSSAYERRRDQETCCIVEEVTKFSICMGRSQTPLEVQLVRHIYRMAGDERERHVEDHFNQSRTLKIGFDLYYLSSHPELIRLFR